MKNVLKIAALGAGLGLAVGFGGAANAATVDIPGFIDGGFGEKAVADGTVVEVDGIKFAVSATNSDASTPTQPAGNTIGGSAPYAYFDKKSGGLPGGLGVCQVAGSTAQCDPSSDDNVTGTDGDSGFDEVLSLNFVVDDQETVDISMLYFRNAAHGTSYAEDGSDKIDIKVNDGTWVEYTLGTAATATALGQVLLDWTEETEVTSLMLRYVNAEFYLTGFDYSNLVGPEPIPLPAGILLMLSGLLGLGFLGRFKAKTA